MAETGNQLRRSTHSELSGQCLTTRPSSPGMDSRSGSKQGNKLHTMTPASPERKVSAPMGAAGTAAALKQIGTPDHSGHLKKKGETIGWKTRYFVLKGSHLYYLKSEEVSLKHWAVLTSRRTVSKAISTSRATESLWTKTPILEIMASA